MTTESFMTPQPDWLPLLRAIPEVATPFDFSSPLAPTDSDIEDLGPTDLVSRFIDSSPFTEAEMKRVLRIRTDALDVSVDSTNMMIKFDFGEDFLPFERQPWIIATEDPQRQDDLPPVFFQKVKDEIQLVWSLIVLPLFGRSVAEERTVLWARQGFLTQPFTRLPPDIWRYVDVSRSDWGIDRIILKDGTSFWSVYVANLARPARPTRRRKVASEPAIAEAPVLPTSPAAANVTKEQSTAYKLQRAEEALKRLFPQGAPPQKEMPNKVLASMVIAEMKKLGLGEVHESTILRAAGRRKVKSASRRS